MALLKSYQNERRVSPNFNRKRSTYAPNLDTSLLKIFSNLSYRSRDSKTGDEGKCRGTP